MSVRTYLIPGEEVISATTLSEEHVQSVRDTIRRLKEATS